MNIIKPLFKLLHHIQHMKNISNICHAGNYINKYINASEKNPFIDSLIVIMQQNGSVVQR